MGLPYSVPLGALSLLMPDATQVWYNGYDIQNGTWKWGQEPLGEVAYAIQEGVNYGVYTPNQFDDAYPVNPTPTPIALMEEDENWEDLMSDTEHYRYLFKRHMRVLNY